MSVPSRFFGESLGRVIVEKIDDASESLRRSGGDIAEGVHEARKRLKEARALLRLIEPSFPGAREIRLMLRDTGRDLAASRDAGALVEAFEKVIAALEPSARDEGEIDRLRELLVPRPPPARAVSSHSRTLTAARVSMQQWHAETLSLQDVRRALRSTYTAAREQMFAAACTRHQRAFHEWRKRTKEQWYQVIELSAYLRDIAAAREGALRQLSRTLGDHHDSVMLLDRLTVMNDQSALSGAIQLFTAERLRELEEEALALGWILFRDRPARWMRRFESIIGGAGALKEADNRDAKEATVRHAR